MRQQLRGLHAAVFSLLLLVCTSAAAINGSWKGVLLDNDGKTKQVTFRFSPTGNPIIRVETRSGPRDIELTRVGQTTEWLLPGSGYTRGTVKQLSVASGRVQAVMLTFTEGMIGDPRYGGRMYQTTSHVQYDFQQQGNTLSTTVSRTVGTQAAGGAFTPSSSKSRSVLRGELRRGN